MDKTIVALDSHVYLPPCQAALDAMQQCFGTRPSKEDLRLWEEPIYALAGASSDDLFSFTASGAEAIGQVIWSVFSQVARKVGKTHMIVSSIDDAPALQMFKRCEELGCHVKIAPVDAQGKLDLDQLAQLITPRTALISTSIAHGLTGVVQPIDELGKLAKEKGVLLHLDASYALGKIPFSLADSGADYVTFSGSPIHSVPSSGGAFAKQGRPLTPLVLGAPLDFASLAALSAAARLSLLFLDTMGLEIARFRDLLETEVQSRIPDTKVLFQSALRLPNTSVIEFPFVHAEALLFCLQRKGVYANACGVYFQHLHSVLLSSGTKTESALSFSLSRMMEEKQILQASAFIVDAVQFLRGISKGCFDE